MTREKYAIIGAGPAGLAGARNLQKKNSIEERTNVINIRILKRR